MKRLSFSIILILLIIAASDMPQAKVSGQCANCHTMHSSQGGPSPSEWTDKGWTPGTTIKSLLVGSCQGCHCQGGAVSITADGIPQVFHTEYGDDLAGGNFKYVTLTNGHAAGHNVEGIVATDDPLGKTPPGYNASYDPSTTLFNDSNRLTCAGSNGCHGNREYTDPVVSVKGGHHGDDTCLKFGYIDEDSQGTSVATSYRFLYKVKGGEDADWQQASTASKSKHNEYKGYFFTDQTIQTWSSVDTISEFCAECHGLYHMGTGGIGTASPWLRHPTDRVLPSGTEYASYNPDESNAYSLLAPVARQSIPNSVGQGFTVNSDVIMCLSCHRAHASGSTTPEPYYKLMRWDNKENMSGCVVCHTSKS